MLHGRCSAYIPHQDCTEKRANAKSIKGCIDIKDELLFEPIEQMK